MRQLVVGCTMVVLLCTQVARAQHAPEELNGVWEGAVSIVGVAPERNSGGYRIGDSTHLRVELFLDGERVSVASPGYSPLRNVHVGLLGSSAIIFGVTQAGDRIENWVLTVSLKDEPTMLVALSRGVPDFRAAAGTDAVTVGALGTLSQIDDD